MNEWISVKDRLPKAGERVIATDGVMVGEVFMGNDYDFYRNNFYGSSWMRIFGTKITHWMKLPKPPKEEEV